MMGGDNFNLGIENEALRRNLVKLIKNKIAL